MIKFKKLLKISWFYTLYFNFHYLPFKQAIKIPIFLYKPTLLKCKGSVEIKSNSIKTGMIQLGVLSVSLYPNTGIIWENHGGKVIFRGKCMIGNASAVSIGKSGCVDFGNDFKNTANMKLTSYHFISFAENVRLAWEVIVMDTSFHRLKDMNGQFKNKGYASISIGKNNWILTKCMLLPGTKTPDYCIFGAGSILNKDYSKYPTHILLAGNPLEIKAKGIWRDVEDDIIDYY